jgi:formylglycine-generating enzyme required for sulfatase activity
MASFDHYHIWLGIPPEDQPPSYYRLLGIPELESDPDVIDAAAERQTIYLRTFQTGDQAKLAEQLLNEVSAARICLLDGKAKARYDKRLKAELESAAGSAALANISLSAGSSSQRDRGRRSGSSAPPAWYQTPWAAAGAGAVVMPLLMLLFWPGGSKPTASKTLPAKTAVAPLLAVAPFDAAKAKAHQQAWSKYLGVPVEYTNSIGMEFMLIPPGEFMMGSPESEEGHHDDEVLHRVRLTKPFYLASCEVTQEQYSKVMGTNPSSSKGVQQPVEEVSWQATAGFLHLLSSLPKERKGEKTYRLPTEAEWEYACRAGTTSRFSFGSSIDKFPEYSWPVIGSPKASKNPHPVGQKLPNAWKLYNLHANVSEWCQDYYGDYPSLPVVDPKGPLTGAVRVRRGGGHMHRIVDCRSASRLWVGAKDEENLLGNENLGFRVVLEIPVRVQPNTIPTETKSLPASLQQGLVAYYPFNGNANDESGNGNDAEIFGPTFTMDRFGTSGHALEFDGVDDHLIARDSLKRFDRATFSAWVKLGERRGEYIVLKPRSDVGHGFSVFRHRHPWTFGVYLNRQPSVEDSPSNPRIYVYGIRDPARFFHVVGTCDGETLGLYLDGEKIGERRVEIGIVENDLPVFIGGWPAMNDYFEGEIDDVRIYQRSLSSAEIRSLYEFEKP